MVEDFLGETAGPFKSPSDPMAQAAIIPFYRRWACQKFCVNGKVYHQNGTRSLPNSIANWLSAEPQC
jgi:hypothetical protein